MRDRARLGCVRRAGILAVSVVAAVALAACADESHDRTASGADATVLPTNTEPAVATQSDSVTTTVTEPSAPAISTSTTAPLAVPESFAPAPPDLAVVADDATVSWSVAGVSDDPADRRYVIDGIPAGYQLASILEAPPGHADARVVTAIFAQGDFSGEPYISVSVTRPVADEIFDIRSLHDGEPATVGGEPALRRKLSVKMTALTFSRGGRRVDVIAPTNSLDLLLPIADSG